jgi:tRNA(Ile)-lysidine synthase
MLETIITFIEQHHLLPADGEIIVAVSGGADSLCLLHLLNQLCGPAKRYPDVRLHVAHLNHQLRGDASEQDAIEVAHLAEQWHLPATIGSIDVQALAHQEQRSLEDAARAARYRFLREVAHGQLIAVAHHQDDQVETLLMHWLRGGGISSMIGLQPRQQDIIRPLLAVTRADTLAYCQQHYLVPQEDASNTDTHFLRNRIRHELLPLLEAMNPGIRETVLRNAEVMRTDAEWIEKQVDIYWPNVIISEQDQLIQLSIHHLLTLPLSIQRHLLRRATARLSAGQSPLELRHFKIIEQLTQREPSNAELMLHLPHQLRATRQGNYLIFTRLRQYEHLPISTTSTISNNEITLPIPGCVSIPGTAWTAVAEIVKDEEVYTALRSENWQSVWHLLTAQQYCVYADGNLIGDRLFLRTRRAGDRIRLLGMAYEKKVQDVLVDRHIPRSERDHIPLFFSTEHCVWLAGVQLDNRVRLTPNTHKIVRLSLIST